MDAQGNFFINEIIIKDGMLSVITSEGTRISYGYVTEYAPEDAEKTIVSIAINKQNQLLLVYNDREVALVGDISTVQTDMDSSTLIYHLNGYTYTVVGVLDYSIKEIVVPETHRGVAVTAIDIGAFNGCENLETITISKSITKIGSRNFSKCKKLSLINYEGNVSEWRNIFIYEYGNNYLFDASIICNYKKTGN